MIKPWKKGSKAILLASLNPNFESKKEKPRFTYSNDHPLGLALDMYLSNS